MTTAMAQRRVFPFSAIVGQDELKRALMMLAVNPRLGGVLIRGEKGTAKSTAARSLASLLPSVAVNEGCTYGCAPARPESWCDDCREREHIEGGLRRPRFESLPLGVTEDQLLGSIDLERALKDGERHFSSGILAAANQGVLYVDEVNLLEDHVVDMLLDVAASGVNIVAREGIRVDHPAEFMLVGTMNPEEGDLRPQLLDRFGLCVEVEGIDDTDERADVVMRRLAFEEDPRSFCEDYEQADDAVAATIARARDLLPQIRPTREWCVAAARIASSLGVHGHRADVLIVKGAATLAALEGRNAIVAEDLERVAPAALRHRMRSTPFDETEISDRDICEHAKDELRSLAHEDAAKKKKSA
jgi:Mg-chelatase subunit ChlI